jgi:hypothetical protein
MTDVFISYAREDRPVVIRLAQALEKLGWTVWWDRRIRTGSAFDRVIEEAIEAARTVIVVWSPNSIGSEWVRVEAAFALEAKKLVPVQINGPKLPLRFFNLQTADLSSWASSEADGLPEILTDDLRYHLGVLSNIVPASSHVDVGQSPAPVKENAPVFGDESPWFDHWMISAARAFLEKNYWKAMKRYSHAAHGGNAEASVHLGVMFESGLAGPKDDNEALVAYKRAIRDGSDIAKFVTHSEVEVLTLESMWRGVQDAAMETGSAAALYYVGFRLSANGDEAEAVDFLKQARDKGHSAAEFLLKSIHSRHR